MLPRSLTRVCARPPPAIARRCVGAGRRTMCAAATPPNGDEPERPASSLLPPFVDASLRGVGQVVFCDSPVSGAWLIGALTLAGNPALPMLASLGTI
jgi:hypothetical protein